MILTLSLYNGFNKEETEFVGIMILLSLYDKAPYIFLQSAKKKKNQTDNFHRHIKE